MNIISLLSLSSRSPSSSRAILLKFIYLIEILLAIVKSNSAHLDCDIKDLLFTADTSSSANSILKHNTALPNGGVLFESIDKLKNGKLAAKCGVIPAQLISNNKSHAKFLLNWNFDTDTSFKISFRLDFIEDYSNLKYYYSIRKYSGLDVFSQVLNLGSFAGGSDQPTNRTAEDFKLKRLKRAPGDSDEYDMMNDENMTNTTKYMILDFNDLPRPAYSNRNYYEIANSMLIVCVIIANLNQGFSFNLPFMCVDIFLDKNYYRYLIDSSSPSNKNIYAKRAHAILIALAPFLFILLLFISTAYFARKKYEYSTYFRKKLNSATNYLTKEDLKPSNIFKIFRKDRSPNRYDLNDLNRRQQEQQQVNKTTTTTSVNKDELESEDAFKKRNESKMLNSSKKFTYPIFQGTNSSLAVRNNQLNNPKFISSLVDSSLIERRSQLNSKSLEDRRRFDTIKTCSSSLTIPKLSASESLDSIDKLKINGSLSFRKHSFRPVKRFPANLSNPSKPNESKTLPNDYKLRKLSDYFEHSFKPIRRTPVSDSSLSSTNPRIYAVESAYRGPKYRRRVADDGSESYEESYV